MTNETIRGIRRVKKWKIEKQNILVCGECDDGTWKDNVKL